jgi:pyruvate dehydrogenase E1 component alpha subunit/2-oxoisovalerate dehydrogenase E1 component alpha subunit
MFQTVLNRGTVGESTFRDTYQKAYRFMLLSRVLDDKFASLYRAGKIHGGVFLGRGQEALSVATGIVLKRGDIFAPLIRDSAGRLAFGEPVLDAVRTYLGSPLGPMRARDGNVHRGRPKDGILPMISHLGAMISVVNGTLLARRFSGDTEAIGATSIGDGATSTGAFHESLNQAGIEKLPVIVVVANNQYAYSTPNERQFACHNLADRALGYGIECQTVDGTDLDACLRTLGKAADAARSGRGPQMIVANLLRLCGHGEHDDANYVLAKLKSSPLGRDCLKAAEEELQCRNWADANTIAGWRAECVQKVEETIAMVQHEVAPDPFKETWCALSAKHLSEGTGEELKS